MAADVIAQASVLRKNISDYPQYSEVKAATIAIGKTLESSKHILINLNDERILKVMHPSMLAFMIESEKQLNSVLFEQMNFFPEKYFETYAKERNYKIEQLETSQDQVSWVTMENSTFEESIEALKGAIDNYSKDIQKILIYFWTIRNKN